MKKLINLNHNNIWTAVEDYRRYTYATNVLDDITDAFVDRLAEDSAYAKKDLRDLFSRSNAWNEDLQAIIINGTKTHNPDYVLVHNLANEILRPVKWDCDCEKRNLIERAIYFFSRPYEDNSYYLDALQALAPNAYRPNKKPSRIFRALCNALGVVNDSKGSDFQRLFAQFADELNGRKLDFKLFVSLNPAHFITMSNPKEDSRGCTLTSCHSLNVTDYEYNCGCSGYARDDVTFIVFTAADPDVPETLNNRKTSRQLFMYRSYNGLLLQSRLYNTHGGTSGHQAESDLYRDFIQRQISELEGIPNLWHTENYVGNKRNIRIACSSGFGGYADWVYSEFNAKISVHEHHLDDFQTFEVGTYGLCISCADEISEKLYCENCDPDDRATCDYCGEHCYGTTEVIENGNRIYVCDSCLEEDFRYCCHCDQYYPRNEMQLIDNTYVCPNCVEEYCEPCAECGELHHREGDSMYYAFDRDGNEVYICNSCRHDSYSWCDHCHECCHDDTIHAVHDSHGSEMHVCENCRDNHFTQCEQCEEFFPNDDILDGLCQDCRRQQEEQ